MSHKEILEKAIQKAIDGGWDAFGYRFGQPTLTITPVLKQVQFRNDSAMVADCDIATMIFNHDFAKALWPGGEIVYRAEVFETPDGIGDEYLALWEMRLQQMAISEDPVKYLGDNI